MTCSVRNCTAEAVTSIDLDPDKIGGWSSYSYKRGVCQRHADELGDPETQWVTDNFDGSGPEILIGEDLSALDEWALMRETTVTLGNANARSSANVPRRRTVTLTLRQTGSGALEEISFAATTEEARDLIETLQMGFALRDE